MALSSKPQQYLIIFPSISFIFFLTLPCLSSSARVLTTTAAANSVIQKTGNITTTVGGGNNTVVQNTTTAKSYICPICGAEFKSAHELAIVMISDHMSNGILQLTPMNKDDDNTTTELHVVLTFNTTVVPNKPKTDDYGLNKWAVKKCQGWWWWKTHNGCDDCCDDCDSGSGTITIPIPRFPPVNIPTINIPGISIGGGGGGGCDSGDCEPCDDDDCHHHPHPHPHHHHHPQPCRDCNVPPPPCHKDCDDCSDDDCGCQMPQQQRFTEPMTKANTTTTATLKKNGGVE